MMTQASRLLIAVTVLGMHAAEAQSPRSETTLATVNDEIVTVADLPPFVRIQLQDLRRQIYELQRSALNDVLARRLLDEEAERLGITVDELLQERVEPFVPETSDEDVARFLETNENDLPPLSEEELRSTVSEYLRRQKRDRLVAELAEELKQDARVAVHLSPPRLDVSARGPSRGFEQAPVTVVARVDFASSASREDEEHLARLTTEFPMQVRTVIEASPADGLPAIAARCAASADKFWQYYALLPADRGALSRAELVELASRAGADPSRFSQCIESAETSRDNEDDVARKRADGPGLLVNGIPIARNERYEIVRAAVEDELIRARAAQGMGGAAPPPSPPP